MAAVLLSACGGRKCWTTCYCHHWSNSHFLHCPFCRKLQKTSEVWFDQWWQMMAIAHFSEGFSEKGIGNSEKHSFYRRLLVLPALQVSWARHCNRTCRLWPAAVAKKWYQLEVKSQELGISLVADQCLQNLWILWLWCCLEAEQTLLIDSSFDDWIHPMHHRFHGYNMVHVIMSWSYGLDDYTMCSHEDMDKPMVFHYPNCNFEKSFVKQTTMNFQFSVDIFESQMLLL